jgi:hypothetical protein
MRLKRKSCFLEQPYAAFKQSDYRAPDRGRNGVITPPKTSHAVEKQLKRTNYPTNYRLRCTATCSYL